MPVTGRGLRNIRTLSRRVDCSALAYRGYMQITALEMEKARRATERANAVRRIEEIDARLLQIDKEKHELMTAIASPSARAPARLPGLELKPPARRRSSGFRIRY